MIYPKYHSSQKGTHDHESIFEWLNLATWLPVPIRAIKNDLDGYMKEVSIETSDLVHMTFLPSPHTNFVFGGGEERMAYSTWASNPWRYHGTLDRMKNAGWKLVELWELNDVVATLTSKFGYVCHVCEGFFPQEKKSHLLQQEHLPYTPSMKEAEIKKTYAICPLCDEQIDQTISCSDSGKRLIALSRIPNQRMALRKSLKEVLDNARLPKWAVRELSFVREGLGDNFNKQPKET
jgi:hypothetical protein